MEKQQNEQNEKPKKLLIKIIHNYFSRGRKHSKRKYPLKMCLKVKIHAKSDVNPKFLLNNCLQSI